MQPVFLFSLPRSGSTLVQRILAAHAEIATVSEPWVLLPLVYMKRNVGIRAEYDHRLASEAIKEFENQLLGKQSAFSEELRTFVMRLYEKAANKRARYFLDKTPRYHLIASEIMAIFPQAKFIFLWRNPLSVLGSYIDYFGSEKWNLYAYHIDLFTGASNLVEAYEDAKGRAFGIRYENFLTDGESSTQAIFKYLDLAPDPTVLESFNSVELKGRFGDKSGTALYSSLSREPLDKWKRMICNPLRRRWAREYLLWIGDRRLKIMGYSLDELLNELEIIPTGTRYFFSDCLRMTYGRIVRPIK
jgi:hypothetical protein